MDQSDQPTTGQYDLELSSPPHTGIRALPEAPAWQDEESQCCVASSDLSPRGRTTGTTSSPVRVSRYANMSLNRPHRLAPYRDPESRSRDTTTATGTKKTESARMKKYLKTLSDDEENDLAELEAHVIPRSLAEQREVSSAYGWQPINKTETSQYTTWPLVNNQTTADTLAEDLSTTHITAAPEGDTPDEVGSVTNPASDPVDSEKTGEILDDGDESPWLADKYFDHYGYLNYINNVEDSKDSGEPSAALGGKKYPVQSRLKVADRNRAQLLLDTSPLASPRSPTKRPAKLSTTEDTLMADADLPVRHTLEGGDKATRDNSPESSSDGAGRWELLEGNIDAPRTGNISIPKLFIKLRHTETGETKTVTYTDVEHEAIDWKSKQQVAAIGQWRIGVFQQHGINTKKDMVVYTPLEDAWMTLFHRKLRARIDAGHIITLPGPATVKVPFNAYFEGRALKNANGEDVGTMPARDTNSIRGKLDGRASKIAVARREMRELLDGKKKGEVFVPAITEEELDQFQADGTVAVEDPKEVGTTASPNGEGGKSRRSSPKRKREEKATGGREAKKAKQSSTSPKKLSGT